MPEGLLQVILFLVLGYLLVFVELFVPGGILGVLGILSVAYGCYLAFGLGTTWGVTSIGLSIVVTVLAGMLIVRSRTAKKLVLSSREAKGWKAPSAELAALAGRRGVTLTSLRPAGTAEIDERRVDVVADSEFLDAGVAIEVVEVEGSRVVVGALETETPEPPPL